MEEEKVTTQGEVDNTIGFIPPASNMAMELRSMIDWSTASQALLPLCTACICLRPPLCPS